MMTIGDLFEKPKIILFPENKNDKFYNNCKLREAGIKEAIRITLGNFDVYVTEFACNSSIPKWKKEWMRSCMTNLGDYLEFLINELEKEKIEDYCKSEEEMGERFIPFLSDIVLIMINSYHGAIETDLHWISDILLADSIDISLGKFDSNKLKNYLPQRISEIGELFDELKNNDFVNSHSESYTEAAACFKNSHQKAGNLLIITITEGLVRSLGAHLKEKQGITVDLNDKRKFASLDSFLNKISWKKDLEIDKIKYGLLTGKHVLENDAIEDNVYVNLTERLGFLCRRFKENRNHILHGEETNYATSFNSFQNLSALKEVLLTIKEYNKTYQS